MWSRSGVCGGWVARHPGGHNGSKLIVAFIVSMHGLRVNNDFGSPRHKCKHTKTNTSTGCIWLRLVALVALGLALRGIRHLFGSAASGRAGPAGRSAAARRPQGRLRPGGAPPPNGRRVFRVWCLPLVWILQSSARACKPIYCERQTRLDGRKRPPPGVFVALPSLPGDDCSGLTLRRHRKIANFCWAVYG